MDTMERIVDLDSQEWELLLGNLYVYSYRCFYRFYKTEINQRGKSYTDYVNDAVERHLKGEDNYDPGKSPVDFHLKYNVIRRAIYNDLPPHVKKRRAVVLDKHLLPSTDVLHARNHSEPFVEEVIQTLEESDRKVIFDEIEKAISGDSVLEAIYLAICHDNYNFSDRSEICIAYGISLPEFDNGRRRFRTALKQVFEELRLI